ncbi:hypothetical protein P154DRAFT_524737 [Amniculicola lignicola CBS 123094]|uniref:MutL C-terminal dimerisation domain-containing protein n=1 Tax=Amniculicola lignicola CBS 123094 TaxID=1392246 RepID=A0A6A5W6X3_9PLEO|nr:hypothetical protein P154DRAFT_524737 [Amniculicola lignicola CBS 123094]
MAHPPPGRIRPLPDQVVAQIKSSTAVASLSGVVLELLKNALDAKATAIDASIDFARGSCTVEDSGLGIAPLEFRAEGGLGKLYWTSKYHSDDACLGRHGTFLASLAAVSLLTITSHHHEHRSHNSISLHRAQVIDRQLPAPPQHAIRFDKHGTRVAVRNLFGNLPVRVKQRAVAAEQKPEQDRLWESTKREIVGLLLSWRKPLSLRVRDADNSTVFNFNGNTSGAASKLENHAHRSSELQFVLNALTQFNYITIDDWSSWIPVSASTSTVSVKGAVSLDPVPTKRGQFIALGIRPLSPDSGHNELYDEINRVFALSSFGTVEDDEHVDPLEKVRRETDKRFKRDGYTNRQLTGRKGVDRHPMFHIRISIKDERSAGEGEDKLLEDDTHLQTLLEVIGAMITHWLSVHHFRPRKRRERRRPDTPSSFTNSDLSRNNTPPPLRQCTIDFGNGPPIPSPTMPESRKKKRPRAEASNTASVGKRQRPFTEWSRIKSGNVQFYESAWSSAKQPVRQEGGDASSNGLELENLGERAASPELATFNLDPILPGAFNRTSLPHDEEQEEAIVTTLDAELGQDPYDETTAWTDPVTKQTFLLNARTGCVMSQAPETPTTSETSQPTTLIDFKKSLRLPKRPATTTEGNTRWLNSVLQSWDNPIFKPAEKRIPQVSLEEHQFENRDRGRSHHHGCSHSSIGRAFNESSIPVMSKLSKEGLRDAQIIAQVDKKFILVKSQNLTENSETLVLIDQHAADERIRVEALMVELCAPPSHPQGQVPYSSELGHVSSIEYSVLEKPIRFPIAAQEQDVFTTHAARFAAWGILYDIAAATKDSNLRSTPSRRNQYTLSVNTLPSSISERSKADPKLVSSLLRSTVWKYAEAIHLPPLNSPLTDETDRSPLWLRRLATCPEGLIDMLNSRACRSAIMFNDELTIGECKELVRKLAMCVFPFMCAHGRPSMVPLVDLGISKEGGGLGLGLVDEHTVARKEDFIGAWKRWKK